MCGARASRLKARTHRPITVVMVISDPQAAPAVSQPLGERLQLMKWVAVTMFMFGGATCLLGVAITQSTPFSRTVQAGCAGAFFACGVLLLLTRARKLVIEATVLVSILILGIMLAASNPIGMGPLFYLWPVVYAAYFCSRRVLGLSAAWMLVTLTTGVALNTHTDIKLDIITGTLSSVGLMAALVAAMRQREVRLYDELARIAETDPLTGLLNRRAFNPKLAGMIESAARAASPLTVVMFDLDHFKRFNDEHGHLAGDDALRRMAEVLRGQSREEDVVSRFGGEEFAVALPGAGLDSARSYTERVAHALWEEHTVSGVRLSTSAGIGPLIARATTVDALLALADEALYASKKAGRSRTSWWDGGGLHVGEGFLEPPAQESPANELQERPSPVQFDSPLATA